MKLFFFVNFPVATCQKSIALTQNFSCVYIQPYFFKVFFTFWKKFKTWHILHITEIELVDQTFNLKQCKVYYNNTGHYFCIDQPLFFTKPTMSLRKSSQLHP